jgi:hypothetical protein
MRNFLRLAAGVNVMPLLHQITLHPELWNQNRVRTEHPGSPHSGVDDILLRFQDPKTNVVDDPECIWYPAWDVLTEAHDLIFNLARVVKAERIGRLIISRMAPGRVIAPHEDGGAVSRYYKRYQLALQSRPGCIFECAGESVTMQDGEVYWFRNDLTHSVTNNSNTDRVALIVDLKISQF